MRRFVHKTIGYGVPGSGALVTGIATLGGESVRASIWGVAVAIWHDPVSLTLCVAGLLGLLVVWVWAGWDAGGQNGPSITQTTHGPDSPIISNVTGDVILNPSQRDLGFQVLNSEGKAFFIPVHSQFSSQNGTGGEDDSK